MHCKILLLLLFSLALPVSANEPAPVSSGPVTDLGTTDTGSLLDKLHQRRQKLAEERQKHQDYIDKNPLGGKDAAITIILPGGLLYAAHRKNKLDKAKKRIREIDARLAEIDNDIRTLSANKTPEATE